MKHLFCTLTLLLTLTWASAQSPKHILVEKITSAGCPGCPNGALVLDDLVQQHADIIPVAIHLHDQWHADQMANADGDSILAAYWWAQPTAMIDRVKFADQTRMSLFTSLWDSKIAERRTDPLELTLGASTTYDPMARSPSISLNGTTMNALSGDIRVNAYVVENSVTGQGLGYDQLNGYDNTSGHPLQGLGNPIIGYEHKHVLRDMVGGPWGATGVIPNSPSAGTNFSHTFTTTIDTAWDDQDLTIVVLVQQYNANPEARQILNAISLGVDDQVLASVEQALAEAQALHIYPNPVLDQAFIRLPSSDIDQLRLRDLQGRIVWEQGAVTEMVTFERGQLPAGLYLLEGVDGDEVLRVEKMVLR